MRVAFLVLALVVASSAPAWAAPALVQSPGCGNAATTAALVGAPTNGNRVVGAAVNANNVSAETFLDSNSVSYTRLVTNNGSTLFGYVWDAIVASSPTKTYTVNTSSWVCAYELSGTGAGTGASTGTASSGTTLTVTFAGAVAGDFITCSASWNPGFGTLTSNNGTFTNDAGNSVVEVGHFFATSTTSTTITLSGTAAHPAELVCADYPTVAVASATFGLFPAEGVYPGGMP